ncbi:hypothetical protein SK128_023452, partial [Halocaridina rubra]
MAAPPLHVPAHPESFSKKWQAETEDCGRRAAASTEQVMPHYESRAHPLTKLTAGQRAPIQDPISYHWDKVRVVMGCGRSRGYEVRLPSGRVCGRIVDIS